MPIRKLDQAFCDTAVCELGKRKSDFWDTEIKGFVLEVRHTGGCTFYQRYTDERGRQRQIKIGGASDISCAQARKIAKRLRSETVLGADPLAEKANRKAVPTFGALAEQHIAHAKSYQRSWDSTEGLLRVHIVERWGNYRLDEIKSQEITLWLADKAAKGLAPATVEKIRVTFGRSFELAQKWAMPGASPNPVRSVPRPKFDNKRERFLTSEQVGRLLRAAEQSRNPQLKPIISLLLFTGVRVSELLSAKWQDVDIERQAWLIPMSKTGKSRYVPLSNAALEVIKALPRFQGCPYLIPNPETRLPFVSVKHGWQKVRSVAGLHGLRIHDLRHSAASFMINGGIDLYAVGRILGHADHKSTMRYSHLANETLLRAVEVAASKMTEIRANG